MQQIVKDLNFDRRVCPFLVEKGFSEQYYIACLVYVLLFFF